MTLAGSVSGAIKFGYADGRGTAAKFFSPAGVAVDRTGTLAIVVRSTMGWWHSGKRLLIAQRGGRGGD